MEACKGTFAAPHNLAFPIQLDSMAIFQGLAEAESDVFTAAQGFLQTVHRAEENPLATLLSLGKVVLEERLHPTMPWATGVFPFIVAAGEERKPPDPRP